MKRTKTWLFVLSVVIIAVVLYIVSRNVDDERRLYRLADKQGLILDRRILKKVVKYDIVRCDIPSGVEEIGGKDMFGHFPAFSGCRKLQQVFIPETVKVIATDIWAELKPYVEQGIVIGALDQHMAEQGDIAVKTLHQYLAENIIKDRETKIAPGVLLYSGMMSKISNLG